MNYKHGDIGGECLVVRGIFNRTRKLNWVAMSRIHDVFAQFYRAESNFEAFPKFLRGK